MESYQFFTYRFAVQLQYMKFRGFFYFLLFTLCFLLFTFDYIKVIEIVQKIWKMYQKHFRCIYKSMYGNTIVTYQEQQSK